MSSYRGISLSVAEDQCRRIKDPNNPAIHHYEAYVKFSEAIKLDRGNANVRPSKENKPFRAMLETVQNSPGIFHIKNRGITYICNKFSYDNQQKVLTVTVPNVPKAKLEEDGYPLFGIADGGHTFKAVEEVMSDPETFQDEDWTEPSVRIHFIASDQDVVGIEEVVEALNTSTQVKSFTIDEYRGRFDELKEALNSSKFDVNQVAFRENEEKAWHVTELVQRLSCFLKDRWKVTPPSSMYRSKEKALQLFVNDDKGEFTKLFPVIKEVVTFPEFIQSTLSDHIEGHRLGRVKGVKKQKRQFRRECTDYLSQYKMDTAIVLPMAAAFRSLLVTRGDSYQWKMSPYDVFKHCADELYEVLLGRIRRVKHAGQLAADQEYWLNCEKIVLNTMNDMAE